MNPILEALQYPFMQQALAVALLLAVTCALLSCYIVHKGWALMGDAISHAVLPGIVIASSLGAPLILGAFAAGLTCTLATGWLEERSTLKSDTLLGITPTQLWQVVAICAVVLAILAVKWRDYLLYTFDEAQARLVGMNVPLLHTSLLVMLTLPAIGAMQAVGVVLVVALLIAPGVSAQLVTRRFHHTLAVAVALSVAASISGVLISYHLNASIGASIVLCQAAGFLLMLGLRLIWRRG